jgi:hypothetical protein
MVNKILVLVIGLILLVSCTNAITISNVIKVQKNMTPNQVYEFDTQLSRTGSEDVINVTSITSDGNCASWLTYDSKPFDIVTPIQKHVKISVPSNAENGISKCVIRYTSPNKYNTQTELGLPFTLNIVGSTQVATPPVEKFVSPIATPTPVKNLNISSPTQEVPNVNMWIFITGSVTLLVVTLFSVFVILGRKKTEEDETIKL